MFEGWPRRTRIRRRACTSASPPRLAPDEAYVAVMASSINFNTVWTSIFEPLPTFGFLDRLGKESAWGARHAREFHVVGSDACGVVLRVGSAVRNWRPGDRVTIHCNSVDDQDPSSHDDSMLASNQRIWGFETNFRRPRRAHPREGQPADAQADAPDLGGGGGQCPVQLDELPDAGRRARRPDEAGRRRARVGRHRRHRRLRRSVRAQRWRDTGGSRVVTGEGAAAQRPGCRRRHRPHRRGLPVLARRQHAGRR